MTRIRPLDAHETPDLAPLFELVRGAMGFVPESMRSMARVPGLAPALASLVGAAFAPGPVEEPLLRLVAVMASRASGCRYCQAHTSHSAAHAGVDEGRIAALWSFRDSELFDARERAALEYASLAAQTPSGVDEAVVERLTTHFDADQVARITAVIAAFGFLNRWNDSLATTLEAEPRAFAQRVLAGTDWEPGAHA